jgi:uncharacterized protein (TIGR03083 family)
VNDDSHTELDDDDLVFAAIADERRQLADLFSSLDARQLSSRSLCDGWTVHHVAAHVTTLFNISMSAMMWRIAASRFDFARAVDRLTGELVQRPIEEIVQQLRQHADDRRHPPGRPLAPLTDLIVHGEDVRRPLGIPREVPIDRSIAAMRFITSGRATGFIPRDRLSGFKLVATDVDRSWGLGQVVHGPVIDLLMAAMGRREAFTQLGGAKVALEERLAAGKGRGRRRNPPRVQ